MELHPQKLHGHWAEGYALDLHTSYSKPITEMGKKVEIIDGKETAVFHEVILGWDTKRPPIAEELFQLKYRSERTRLTAITNEAAIFLDGKADWEIDLIIPIPPSDTTREFQPVKELAKAIGAI